MESRDCIVVLGPGVTPDGSLTRLGKSRVETGVALYKKKKATKILFCGGYSYKLNNVPQKTEAEAMKDYAISLGVPKKKIFLEEYSRDTLGNAFFARVFLEKNDFKSFFIVTSNYHLPKTAYTFKKVFGKEFNFEIIPCLTYLRPDEILDRLDSEREKLQLYKQFLGSIIDGDKQAIQKIMATLPWYAEILKIL